MAAVFITTVWSTLLMASVTLALWPAFPADMGAMAGKESNPPSSPKRRLPEAVINTGDKIQSCTCSSEVGLLDSRSRDLETKIQELQKEMDRMQGAVNLLKKDVGSTPKGGNRISSPQNYNVAFSARVGYNRPYLGETEVVVFDELVVNNGDFYDPYSGKFRSPIPGLYHFETTILSGFNDSIETMLVMNGNEVGRIFSGGFNSRGSGSNNVLLNLQQGDEVWVSVFFGNGNYVHGLWSTFSGYLITAFNN